MGVLANLRESAPIRTPHAHCARRYRSKRAKGTALLAALATVFLVVLIGTAILANTLQGLHLARHVREGTLAFNVAESGAERAVRWLKDQPFPPPGTEAIDPFGGAQAMGDGTYSVTVTPDIGNGGFTLKKYKIVASGSIYGRTEQVELILRQQSFGRYAYFTNREVSSIGGGRIWFISADKIRGPAHSNNVGGSNFQINWGASPGPIFEDMVTGAGPRMDYAPTNPSTEPQFLQVYRTGSRGYQVGVDRISLPSSSDVQKEAAWGGSSGFPGATGVYVPVNGGIYVVGDSTVQLQVDGSGNQVFRITQGVTITTVTVDLAANERRVQVGLGPVTTVPGRGSGVLYSSNHITSLSGTIANNRLSAESPPSILTRSAYTIATDVNGSRNITITGPVRYASAPDANLPINDPVNLRPGTLGLIARNVVLSSLCPTAMEVNAVVMAGSETVADGSFYVQNYNTKVPTGTLKLIGGLIQKDRGPVGTFSGGVIRTGYVKDYHYDPRLADYPPPYFPTTGNYDRVSWRRLADD